MRCGETTAANRPHVSVPAAAVAVALRTMPEEGPGVAATRTAFAAALGQAPVRIGDLDKEAARLRDGAFVDAVDDAMLNLEQVDFSNFDFEAFTESLERRGYAIVKTKGV